MYKYISISHLTFIYKQKLLEYLNLKFVISFYRKTKKELQWKMKRRQKILESLVSIQGTSCNTKSNILKPVFSVHIKASGNWH